MFDTPVLFMMFNRPECTQEVFNVIRRIQPSKLFVAADGPRPNMEGEKELCEKAKLIITNGVNWDCDLHLLFRDENLGCGKAIKGSLDWFFSFVDEGIILEDDTLPDVSFFSYCEKMLNLYRNEKKVWSISGFNFGADTMFQNENFLFARFMNMWGWATWKRSYDKVDYSLEKWRSANNKKLYTSILVQDNLMDTDVKWFEYWTNIFRLIANNQLDTWDYQWIYSQLLNYQVTIYPAVNMIENIGFKSNATHTTNHKHPLALIQKNTFNESFDVKSLKVDYNFQDKYIKRIWCDLDSNTEPWKIRFMFKLRQLKYLLKNRMLGNEA
jgi:hypothetical protein